MRHPVRHRRLVVLTLTGLLLTLVPSASAHLTKVSGPFRVSLGWGNEPPYAGLDNFIEVDLADAAGAPVGAAGALEVEVSIGGSRTTLPLLPTEEPGAFRAVLVPTRPGAYSFHITGAVNGRPIDAGSTCSEQTFECVAPVSEVEFPIKDPSVSEVAQRLSRELPRAEQRGDTADQAKRIAFVAVGLAAISLAVALLLGMRSRRKRS